MEENEIVKVETIHEIAKYTEPTPVSKIERGLSDFISDTFQMIHEEDQYKKSIQIEIMKRLPNLTNSEIIALITSQSSNQNDLISKVISPTMALLTAAQQAEMAKNQKEAQASTLNVAQTNIREINQIAPQEAIVGLKALFDLVQISQKSEIGS